MLANRFATLIDIDPDAATSTVADWVEAQFGEERDRLLLQPIGRLAAGWYLHELHAGRQSVARCANSAVGASSGCWLECDAQGFNRFGEVSCSGEEPDWRHRRLV